MHCGTLSMWVRRTLFSLSTKVSKGRLKLPGMCPLLSSGRGSGSVPRNLGTMTTGRARV